MNDTVVSGLGDITSALGQSHKLWKASEKKKDEYRKAFFEAATRALEDTLQEKVVDIKADTDEEALSIARRRYPAHEAEDWRLNPERAGWYEVILIENPDLKPFAYVNEADGQVYARQVSQGSAMLDDEALAAADPELYKLVTYVPYYDYLANMLYEANIHQNEIAAWLENHFDWFPPERKLRKLDDLAPELLGRLQEYIYFAAPVPKLATPRKAKPEDT